MRVDKPATQNGSRIPMDKDMNQLIREGHYESALVQAQVSCLQSLHMQAQVSRGGMQREEDLHTCAERVNILLKHSGTGTT